MMKYIAALSFIVFLFGCQQPSKQENQTVLTVHKQTLDQPLFFAGTLQPLTVVNVPSPADGFVVKKQFQYGQTVSENSVVLTIHSEQLQKDYTAALTAFLKSKQELSSSQAKLNNDRELLRLGIIARDTYLQSKNTFDNDRVSFLEASKTLKEALKKGSGDYAALENLDISNIKAVEKALHVSYAELTVKAPVNGVALMPPPTSSMEDKSILVGTKVETGQVLLSIGDLSGLSVAIDVGENDVSHVRPGTLVQITGSAFPNHVLDGVVQSVDNEAKQDNRYGAATLPQFAAKIVVPHLNKETLEQVRVGMSAKIHVLSAGKETITVPIQAVHETGGQFWVTQLIKGKKTQTQISTGAASADSVQVVAGLQEGDQIIVTNGNKA